jgi:hypothetical protein
MLEKIRIITFKTSIQKPASSIFSIRAIPCVTNVSCHEIQKKTIRA